MMKKSRNRRRRIARLTSREIKNCEFFAITGRRIKACKVEVKFRRDNNVVASVVFIDDAPNKQTIIRWYDHRYFALRYGAKEAEPLNMTLAKWKTINND
ncbi:hypothetical protein RJT12_05470 [Segatella copri]|uniref:hypothetical protein n=1 Tax=Segatella copri TaxID=165179 RepID=UPI00294AF953|nr:hypothetical protein [Segatella copri]WOF98194.1 hypothetical protein RJT12_05470 [Segatella copri]